MSSVGEAWGNRWRARGNSGVIGGSLVERGRSLGKPLAAPGKLARVRGKPGRGRERRGGTVGELGETGRCAGEARARAAPRHRRVLGLGR